MLCVDGILGLTQIVTFWKWGNDYTCELPFFWFLKKKKKKEGRSRGLNNLRICILEHSHPIFTKNSTLPSQKLFYYLYYTILQHTQHPNFYFPIQYIKIIYLPNKIYNLKVIEREREK